MKPEVLTRRLQVDRTGGVQPSTFNFQPATAPQLIWLWLRRAALLCVFALSLFVSAGHAQVSRPAKGFKVDSYFPAPHETQIKFHLEGATFTQLASGRFFLLNDMTLQTYRETGEGEFLIKAPECLYDSDRTNASSAGPLHVQTADGKFSIDGDGFLWEQPSSLFISNNVHTIVQRELLESPGASPSATTAQPEARNIEIFSRRFEYTADPGEGIYRDAVRVTGTNLALTCGTLKFQLPMSSPPGGATPNVPAPDRASLSGLQSINAEQDVIVDYATIHAEGTGAVYSARTGLLHLTGNPTWRADQRQGHGDELVIDRTNNIFTATGHGWLKLPGQTLGQSGFLPGVATNSPTASAATNQTVELACATYEIHTNWALFREDVRATNYLGDQARSKMSCALMTVTFGGTNQVDRLVAETNVVIEQEDKRLAGGRAVYTGANGLLELTDHPSWQSGLREGQGALVQVEGQRGELRVRGNAFMRLPAAELGQPETLASGAAPKPAPDTGTNQFAEIYCDSYLLRTNTAWWTGGVYVSHPRMNWVCERLTANLGPAGAESKTMVAEEAVTFDLRDQKGQTVHGTGDKAIYDYNVTGAATNDLLTLTGAPAFLQTTNGTIRDKLVLLDRANSKLVAPGNYLIRIRTNGTNTFAMPGNRFKR
ncbi:MAG TPA: hypothetical protein VN578_15650 [Candidatus Binatia bacterium]|jgi:lipopolysaccharide export system protein LptA|nr:hypothetical protein [Candidatus Binatia bacterium]